MKKSLRRVTSRSLKLQRDFLSSTHSLFALRKGIQILECDKILLVESGILGFGIRNTARNPTNDWNPESKFHWQRLKPSTLNPESPAWNPESKTVLDSVAWGDFLFNVGELLGSLILNKLTQLYKEKQAVRRRGNQVMYQTNILLLPFFNEILTGWSVME